MPEVFILVKAKDEASKTLQGISGGLAGLGKGLLAVGAVGGVALVGLAVGVAKLATDAMQLEPVRKTFENLTADIGTTSKAMLDALRPATMGVLSDADLMRAANKLMAMGLAESTDEAARLARMATTLGIAMGEDATTSLENFTLMLANQSIPRLDTFGISSGQVRVRIEELMAATEGLTREQAFMQATMELGEEAMGRVGDVSDTGAVKLANLQATMTNLKDELGTALIPIFQVFLDTIIVPLVEKLREWAPLITPVIEQFGYLAQAIMDPEQDWVAFLNNEVWEALENAFGAEAADKIVEFVQDTLIELGELYTQLQEEVVPELQRFAGIIIDDVIPALVEFATGDGINLFLDALGLIVGALGAITNAIDETITKIQELEVWSRRFAPPEMRGWTGRAYPYMEPGMARAYFGGWGEAMGRQPETPAPGSGPIAVNVYGLPGLEDEIQDIIRNEGRLMP